MVAPPLYVISTTSTDKTAALDVMEKAVEAIGDKIKEEGGDMVVKMAVSLGFLRDWYDWKSGWCVIWVDGIWAGGGRWENLGLSVIWDRVLSLLSRHQGYLY